MFFRLKKFYSSVSLFNDSFLCQPHSAVKCICVSYTECFLLEFLFENFHSFYFLMKLLIFLFIESIFFFMTLKIVNIVKIKSCLLIPTCIHLGIGFHWLIFFLKNGLNYHLYYLLGDFVLFPEYSESTETLNSIIFLNKTVIF